jgi:transcriptional regulator with XRE-family HTH domain
MTEKKDAIEKIRQQLGWSREQMGEAIGKSRTWIWKIEEHHAKMTRDDAEAYTDVIKELTGKDPNRGEHPDCDILLASNWNLWITRTVFEEVKSEDTSPGEKARLMYKAHATTRDIQELDIPDGIKDPTEEKKQDIEDAIQNLEAWMEKPTEERIPTEKISRRIAQKVS